MGDMGSERELKSFQSKYQIVPNGCWEWTSRVVNKSDCRKRGYFFFRGKNTLAHRVSYQLFVGEIPKGLLVCHTCDVSICVNPNHLYVGTQKDNVRDMHQRKRAFVHTHPTEARENSRRAGLKNIWSRGENNSRCKLSVDDVDRIRKEHKARGTKALADLYSLNRTTVQRIVSGKLWPQDSSWAQERGIHVKD